MNYQIEMRSQHSRGNSASQFGGPDRYMAVLAVPEGVEAPHNLRRDVLAKRNIQYYYIGEFYSKNKGSRSAFTTCLASANELIAELKQSHSAN